MDSLFDGQQTDERVLYTVSPHPFPMRMAIIRNGFLALFFVFILLMISQISAPFSGIILIAGSALCLICLGLSIWWNMVVFTKDRTYITDRRIIRFAVASPFFTTKRALFWNEALKAKAYAPNFLYKILKIGNLEVEPMMGEEENVRVTDVFYYEDLANYVDKILYTVKNTPQDISLLKPFVPKPKGMRG